MRTKLRFTQTWLLATFILFTNIGSAQLTEEWVARFNGTGNSTDGARSLVADDYGNVYITGSATGTGTGLDYRTIKYNAAGVLQWKALWNGGANGDDEAFSIAVDGNGNVYVTGRSEGNGTGDDYATVKYNSAGVRQWSARFNGPENGFDFAKSIKVDSKGNVYVTGESGLGANTTSDYVTIKYNTNGTRQWVARYDGPGRNDGANALAVDEDLNVYVTGKSPAGLDLDEQDADYTTIKYNKNGQELWVRRYDGPVAGNLFDEALAITLDKWGNAYVTGRSVNSNLEDANDYATVKYDANGNEQWAARYNGPGNSIDDALDIALDAWNNVYVTGYSAAAPEETNYDYATIRYDAQNGQEVWVSRYNGPANDDDQASSLAVDKDGNVYVTGRSRGIGTGFDFATVKYNGAGVEQSVARYNGPGNGADGTAIFIGFFTSHPIAVDKNGNVYVTGLSTGIGTGFDITTIKYSQPFTAPSFVIGGVSYIGCQPSETVVAPFTTTAGGVTTNQYSGLVLLKVSGTGQSAGTSINDAFYFDIPDNPTHEPDFFQLVTTIGPSVFAAPVNPNTAYRHIVYDADAGTAVTPPYVPPFRADNTYTFIINMNTLDPAPAGPSIIRFGVSDGVVADNSGAYTVQVTQLCEGCGHKGDKAAICHKGNEICISQDEVKDHLDHGDVFGPCTADAAKTTIEARREAPERPGMLPDKLRISVAPNPASASTKIFYDLPLEGRVSLAIFDVLGRRVTTLVDANKPAGFHNAELNAATMQNGMYYYRILVKTAKTTWSQTGKINIVK